MDNDTAGTTPAPTAPTGPWVITASGLRLYLLNPRPDSISLQDIAHSLARQCRYNGHTPHFYSVAEHSVLASLLAPPGLELPALLHDAAEAYVGDVIAPVKDWLGAEFRLCEHNILNAVKIALDVYWAEADLGDLDRRVRSTEAACLFGADTREQGWGCADAAPFAGIVPQCWPPEEAEQRFLARFHQLNQAGLLGRGL